MENLIPVNRGKESIALDDQGAVASLEILNSDGKGIGQIHELKCQAVTRSQLESVLSLKANISDWMYEWQWRELAYTEKKPEKNLDSLSS